MLFSQSQTPRRVTRRRARDSQRSKLYAAERMLPEIGTMDLGSAPSVEEVQAFVKKVLARKRVIAKFGRGFIRATHNQGKGGSRGGGGVIYMATYHRNSLVILHEMAHCLAPSDAWHDYRFAETYLFLVREVMGRDVGERLKAAFKVKGVRFRPKIKREITEEQRQALRDRLAKYRGGSTALAAMPNRDADVALARGNQG